MIKKSNLLITFLLAFACISASAQNKALLVSHSNALETFAGKYPIEKVHLHLDRPWYGLGDTIWFKAYTVIGPDHKLSGLSTVLYAELINDKDSVVRRLTMALTAGVSQGDFVLPHSYKSGTYRLRAYTNWMRNAGPAYFYDEKVYVSGAGGIATNGLVPNRGSAVNTANNQGSNPDVQFFPEGGDLVAGLRSKVGFKAVNKNGAAEAVHGIITDDAGSEVAMFDTQHFGMGQFALAPQKGKQYTAKITAADGSSFSVPLPPAKEAGFTLSINNNNPDSLYLKVAPNEELYKRKTDTAFYLVAQSGGKVYFAAEGKIGSRPFVTQLAKSRFPSGIVQFTLFSQSGEPINERIVFIQNNDQLNIALALQKQTYAPGEKVTVNMDAGNAEKTGIGTFSVSVTDETKVPANENAESNIFTDLLLKSELAGRIDDPNYYFIDPNDETRANLDLLMLTQGYRRFEWKKILSGNVPPAAYQAETGLTLSGTVKTPSGEPIPKGEVILSSLKDKFVVDTLTDERGNFSFSNIALPDTGTVIINAKKASGGRDVKITIHDRAYARVNKEEGASGLMMNNNVITADYADKISQASRAWHDDSLSHVIQLKQVDIKNKRLAFSRPDYAVTLKSSTNLNGPGMADQVLMTKDIFMGCANLVDCLQGRLFGVTFSNGIAFSLRTITRHLMGPPHPMAIYVNGARTPPDMLNMINPTDVNGIEVLTSAMYTNMYGTDASGGALIITLKNGSEFSGNELSAPKGLITYKFMGYYKGREFYSPKYEAGATVSQADQRKTIYWDPEIITDKSGKASFEYFNAAGKGTYRVVVEGVDENGKLGRKVFRYTVE